MLKEHKEVKKEEEETKAIEKNRRKSCFRPVKVADPKNLNWGIIYQKGFATQEISQWNKVKLDIASTQEGQSRQLDIFLL